jgi:hypothetical protein
MKKIAFIRKLPNGKYRVYSHTGKNLGTSDTLEEAKARLQAVEYFKHKDKKAQNIRIQLLNIFAEKELSYSAIMRDLNKNDKDKLELFMKQFKKSFDEAIIEDLEDPDKIALISAMKAINYENN